MRLNKVTAIIASLSIASAAYSSVCADHCVTFNSHEKTASEQVERMPCHEEMPENKESKNKKNSSSDCSMSLCAQLDSTFPSYSYTTLEPKASDAWDFSDSRSLTVTVNTQHINFLGIIKNDAIPWRVPIFLKVQRFLI